RPRPGTRLRRSPREPRFRAPWRPSGDDSIGFMSLYDAFAPISDLWAHMTADVAFYVELARETDGPLVELAVGNGRVAIPVARETGRHVLRIDSSPATLCHARESA